MTQENMLEGRNLRALLDQGPLPVARAIQLAHDIAAELANAHLKGVVHGSLKPSDILISPSGAVKITGFGGGQIDHRSDIFSLGALFYEMLTQLPPAAEPPPPSELNQHVPRALDAIVLSMLAKEPADRMPGVPILIRELQRLKGGLGLAPDRIEPGLRTPGDASEHRKQIIGDAFDHHRAMMQRESERRRTSASRLETFVAVGVVLLVLGIGFGGFMYFTSSPNARAVAKSRIQEAPAASAPTAPLPVAGPPKAPAAPQALPTSAMSDQETKAPAGSGLTVPPSMAEVIKKPATEPSTPAREAPRTKQAAAKAPEQQPRGKAQLILAVSPGGEIYIDGNYLGETPPMTTFDLDPGMYRIEVRSASHKPFLTYMTVEPGDVRRIRHDFDAKPSRPPS